MKKVDQTFMNFENALKSLETAVATPPTEERDYGGIIKAFESVYELHWKLLKLILESNGVSAPFPRVVFEEAYKAKLVEGNEIWKEIMEARNQSVHTYDKNMAADLCQKIKAKYVGPFKKSEILLRGALSK